uniref:Uncharacterized protein n=1 Tax=Sparus aurata TaxID=8175 RepID=A0A671YW99_SPAAU
MESQVEDLVTVLSQRLNLHTGDTVKETSELPVPRHIAVEQRPPKELISGDSQPLPAGQPGSQHGVMGSVPRTVFEARQAAGSATYKQNEMVRS